MAVVGSIAVNDPDMFQAWLFAYGPAKIILGADVRDNKIAVAGWTDITTIDLHDFVTEYKAMGVRQVLCTDISKDGMLAGSSVDLYRELTGRYNTLDFIASGGISSVNEIHSLNESGVAGAIIGKALYEGLIRVEDLKEFL
jgi:phosphoribosylformimino-5-aminoimidazole carboxamide ribotide isomerase